MSNKPSLHSLEFATRYTDAELPKFIIMIDDDTWVNVSNMREIVGKLNPEVRNIVRNLALSLRVQSSAGVSKEACHAKHLNRSMISYN